MVWWNSKIIFIKNRVYLEEQKKIKRESYVWGGYYIGNQTISPETITILFSIFFPDKNPVLSIHGFIDQCQCDR